jgi:hypothetical protein
LKSSHSRIATLPAEIRREILQLLDTSVGIDGQEAASIIADIERYVMDYQIRRRLSPSPGEERQFLELLEDVSSAAKKLERRIRRHTDSRSRRDGKTIVLGGTPSPAGLFARERFQLDALQRAISLHRHAGSLLDGSRWVRHMPLGRIAETFPDTATMERNLHLVPAVGATNES